MSQSSAERVDRRERELTYEEACRKALPGNAHLTHLRPTTVSISALRSSDLREIGAPTLGPPIYQTMPEPERMDRIDRMERKEKVVKTLGRSPGGDRERVAERKEKKVKVTEEASHHGRHSCHTEQIMSRSPLSMEEMKERGGLRAIEKEEEKNREETKHTRGRKRTQFIEIGRGAVNLTRLNNNELHVTNPKSKHVIIPVTAVTDGVIKAIKNHLDKKVVDTTGMSHRDERVYRTFIKGVQDYGGQSCEEYYKERIDTLLALLQGTPTDPEIESEFFEAIAEAKRQRVIDLSVYKHLFDQGKKAQGKQVQIEKKVSKKKAKSLKVEAISRGSLDPRGEGLNTGSEEELVLPRKSILKDEKVKSVNFSRAVIQTDDLSDNDSEGNEND